MFKPDMDSIIVSGCLAFKEKVLNAEAFSLDLIIQAVTCPATKIHFKCSLGDFTM